MRSRHYDLVRGFRTRFQRAALTVAFSQRPPPSEAAFTIAKMTTRTASGMWGQAATTTAKSASSSGGLVALSITRCGRQPPLAVATWRRSVLSSCDATLLQTVWLDVL